MCSVCEIRQPSYPLTQSLVFDKTFLHWGKRKIHFWVDLTCCSDMRVLPARWNDRARLLLQLCFLPALRDGCPDFFFGRSVVYCTAFSYRQVTLTMKQDRRHRPVCKRRRPPPPVPSFLFFQRVGVTTEFPILGAGAA